MQSGAVVTIERGWRIDLRQVPPLAVRAEVRRSVDDWLWAGLAREAYGKNKCVICQQQR